jgi:rod shape-determining protein MreB
VATLDVQSPRGKTVRRTTWVGEEARTAARESPAVQVVRPVVRGRIGAHEALDLVLEPLLRRARAAFGLSRFFPAMTGLLAPSGLTDEESLHVREAGLRHGLSGVRLIDQAAAAAEGCGLSSDAPGGHMVVDFGGGKTCVTVLSMGGIVARHWSGTGSLDLDSAIVAYAERRHRLRISQFEAERIKHEIGSVYPLKQPRATEVIGVQSRSGNPHKIGMDDSEVRDVLIDACEPLVQALQQGFKTVPPEMASDILRDGVMLAGGGALLPGLPEFLGERTGLRFRVVEDPINAVIQGAVNLLWASARAEDEEHADRVR